ncbi:hypothetical protein IAD21_03725 [Abditibacteriota bacterium]|nr:hypothetical protein IAD21_03725 [Abditibacteriota bacterium]
MQPLKVALFAALFTLPAQADLQNQVRLSWQMSSLYLSPGSVKLAPVKVGCAPVFAFGWHNPPSRFPDSPNLGHSLHFQPVKLVIQPDLRFAMPIASFYKDMRPASPIPPQFNQFSIGPTF